MKGLKTLARGSVFIGLLALLGSMAFFAIREMNENGRMIHPGDMAVLTATFEPVTQVHEVEIDTKVNSRSTRARTKQSPWSKQVWSIPGETTVLSIRVFVQDSGAKLVGCSIKFRGKTVTDSQTAPNIAECHITA